MNTVLLTGAAGFIGSHVARNLLANGYAVVGLDNMNDYYDPRLKQYRVDRLLPLGAFRFANVDVRDARALETLFTGERLNAVIHLAAMAGVRYSQEHPDEYVTTNIGGTLNILRLAEKHGVGKIVFASSSSVYSGSAMPFREESVTDSPISTYGATKKSGELLMHAFHAQHGICVAVLRYFSVYGPQGRPDMSYFRFIRAIDEGVPLHIHGDGSQSRDFTYVDDAARATVEALNLDGFHVLNVAGGKDPVSLNTLVELTAGLLGKQAMVRYGERHATDLERTQADISKAIDALRWKPRVEFREGLRSAVEWHVENRDFVRSLRY